MSTHCLLIEIPQTLSVWSIKGTVGGWVEGGAAFLSVVAAIGTSSFIFIVLCLTRTRTVRGEKKKKTRHQEEMHTGMLESHPNRRNLIYILIQRH